MPLPADLQNAGLAWTSPDLEQLIGKFNVYGMPDYDNAPEPFIGHIFMSRPSLAVANNIDAIKRNAQLHSIITDPYGRELAMSLDERAKQKWIPLITTRAKNYSVNDIELKTVEKGSTFYGHTINYSKHSEDHKMGGTFSMDFRNDRFNSILKLIYFWAFYIYNVSKNDSIVVNPIFEEKGILDYCGSLYYVVTKTNHNRIIYWEKLVGVRPKKIPLSIFSWDDVTKIEDTVSVDFEYGLRSDPEDPAILMDINVLNNLTPESAGLHMHSRVNDAYGMWVRPTYNLNYNGVPFADGPYVSAYRDNGIYEYYLEFK